MPKSSTIMVLVLLFLLHRLLHTAANTHKIIVHPIEATQINISSDF